MLHKYQLLVRAGIKSDRVAWVRAMQALPPLNLEELTNDTSPKPNRNSPLETEKQRILEKCAKTHVQRQPPLPPNTQTDTQTGTEI